VAEQIIVSPERLQAISKQMTARGEVHQQNLAVLRSELSSLLGRWKGDAANAHNSEMEQVVFPAFQRLIDALNHGAQVVQATMQNFDEAQIEGEKPLKQLSEVVPAEYKSASQNGAAGSSTGQVQTGSVGAPTGSGAGAGSDGGASGGGGQQGGGSSGGGGNPAAGGSPTSGGQAKGAGTGARGTPLSGGSGSGDDKGSSMTGGPAAAPAEGGNSAQAAFAAVGLAAAAGAKKALDKRNE